MKKIKLNGKHGHGKFALIDDEHFEYINQFNWYVMKTENTFYVKRCVTRTKNMYLHREIMGCKTGDKKIIDHIDGNGLNCQKDNMRFSTTQQNTSNKKSNKVGFKGVYKSKNKLNPFSAKIMWNYKSKHLGYFINEIEAAKAYDKAATKYFGEFARLNFPLKRHS